ncbi:MAG: class I SAM-dependent methyltransferase [Candidatus Bathyarchaeia archaeon]
MKRTLEPEAMEGEEADAYVESVTNPHLEQLDESFVNHALRLNRYPALVLDVGSGPAQIPLRIAVKTNASAIVCADVSMRMVELARKRIIESLATALFFIVRCDAKNLPFRSNIFDLTLCNSTLHHLRDPLHALNEIARVSKESESAVLIRDLRRPVSMLFNLHAGFYGRHYHGRMRELFTLSLKAALNGRELKRLLKKSKLTGCRFFQKGLSHIGIERQPRLNPMESS